MSRMTQLLTSERLSGGIPKTSASTAMIPPTTAKVRGEGSACTHHPASAIAPGTTHAQ